jgi:thiol-disulfide isomerase/thioredoxin
MTIALALVAAGISSACDTAPPPRPASNGVEDAFNTPIFKLDGGTFKLADFKGKVMLVDFWGTFCPPCVKQTPILVELSKRYRAQGLEVVGLTSDEKSDQDKVRDFIKRFGVDYTIGYANSSVSKAFLKGTEDETGAPPLPQLFFISRDGRIVKHLIGDSPEHGLPYFEKIVAEELSLNAASR